MSIAVKGARASAFVLIATVCAAIAWLGIRRHRESVPELPRWFGDSSRPPVRIAGKVFGPSPAVKVRIWIDVPDTSVWSGPEVSTSSNGEFDFGLMRAGRYVLLASGGGWLSRTAVVDTLRGPGDTAELFAYQWSAIEPKLDKFQDGEVADFDWSHARWLSSSHEFVPPPARMPAVTGTVLRSDGTPAAFVGIVPIAQPHEDHAWPYDMGIVTSTDEAGHFSFVPYDDLRGLRVIIGPRTHDVDIAHDRYLPPPIPPIEVRLPAPGSELHGLFSPRREPGDAHGGWLRGRVVRGGTPVPDAHVSVFVPPAGNIAIRDEARTRSDGSFELYVSSRDLDKCQMVMLNAGEQFQGLRGRLLVPIAPGETLDGVTLEVGTGINVKGRVVDETGRAMEGVRVGPETWWETWSAPTDADGRFELTLGPQGRYRLRVFNDARAELPPLEGRLPPAVDVSSPDGVRDHVRVVVRRVSAASREHVIVGWASDGFIDIGAVVESNRVQAVGDELEAAGLRVNDELLATDPGTPDYGGWWLDHSNMVPQGQATTFTARRNGREFELRVDAPYFGAPLPGEKRVRRLNDCR